MKRWKTLSDVPVPDIVEFVRAASKQGQTVHVGTDSLQTGRYTQFVTVVVVLNPGKGGRAVFQREVLPRITSLRERLLKEVWKSVELGLELSPNISSPLHVHIDANPEEKYMSSTYVRELVGLVVGQGFKAIIKPDAWASSHCADHIVRTKGKQPQSVLRDNVLRRAG